MGQKVNPHGYRVGIIKNWDSRWFANDSTFGDTLVEDYNLRKYLKKTLNSAGIAKIEIERDDKRVRLHIHCAKPGMVIYHTYRTVIANPYKDIVVDQLNAAPKPAEEE